MWFDPQTIMVARIKRTETGWTRNLHSPSHSHQRKEQHVFNDNGSFLLALFEFFLFFAWFMCLFWVIGDIFRSRDLSGVAKTFWVFFVIILPWLGILVYLIARGHGMQQRQLEQAQEMQTAQTEYIRSVAGSSGGSSTDQIASAKSLLDSGAITQAEFEALKAKALS
jgi:hypothetical protein